MISEMVGFVFYKGVFYKRNNCMSTIIIGFMYCFETEIILCFLSKIVFISFRLKFTVKPKCQIKLSSIEK
jgi:hypothetical protein